MSIPLPEPTAPYSDTKTRFLDYLDFYRSVIVTKVTGLPAGEMRRSSLPSGWSPIELVKHLAMMERRWLRWGFLGEQVPQPWGDHAGDAPAGRWQVRPDETAESLLEQLCRAGRQTREIVERVDLAERAQVGGRFATEAEAPPLEWILFHVLQEYARHAGHLDIARELVDGSVGE